MKSGRWHNKPKAQALMSLVTATLATLSVAGGCDRKASLSEGGSSKRTDIRATDMTSGVLQQSGRTLQLDATQLNRAIEIYEMTRDAVISRPVTPEVLGAPTQVLILRGNGDQKVNLALYSSERIVRLTGSQAYTIKESELDRFIAFVREIERAVDRHAP